MARIYLSSTSEDLIECRDNVLKALRRMRHEVIGMEDYTATDGSPLEECLQDVESCDVYIGLFAWRYGYIPLENNAEQKSITELEYLKASELGVPSFIFILDETVLWPEVNVDTDRTRILELRDELCNSKIVDFFENADSLATKVSTTVAKWERSLFKASITQAEHESRLKQRELELREELSKETDQTHINLLSLELRTTREKITNLEQSYEEELKRNADLAHSLEKLQTQHPGERLKEALDRVKEGDASKAKQLFTDVVDKGEELNVTFGEAAYQMGKMAEGEVKYQLALDYFKKAVNFQPKNTTYLNALGEIHNTVGQYDQAITCYTQALIFDEKIFGHDDPDVASCLNDLGVAWRNKGEYDKAIGYYKQALTIALQHFGENNAEVATYRNNLGAAWDLKGEHDKAIGYHEQALASALKNFGEDHPDVARYRNNLGAVCEAKGEHDKAIGYYEQALASALKNFGEDHPDVATYRNNLGGVWKKKGEYDRAISYFEQALAGVLMIFGEDHPYVAGTRNNLGLAWKKKGEYDRAIGYFEQALASGIKAYGEHHPDVATSRNNLGMAWYAKGEYDKAIGYYEQALAICKKVLGSNHSNTRIVIDNLNRAKQQK